MTKTKAAACLTSTTLHAAPSKGNLRALTIIEKNLDSIVALAKSTLETVNGMDPKTRKSQGASIVNNLHNVNNLTEFMLETVASAAEADTKSKSKG